MEYLKKTGYPEKGMDLAGTPLTQKSDRPRASYGSLLVSMQTSGGLCKTGRKCVRQDSHAGKCWPE